MGILEVKFVEFFQKFNQKKNENKLLLISNNYDCCVLKSKTVQNVELLGTISAYLSFDCKKL